MRSNWNDAEKPAEAADPSTTLPSVNGGKASFDDVYDQPDPRAYYRTLRPYDYQIPHHAQQLVRRMLGTKHLVAAAERGPLGVLDVCCSYGLNAALLNHTLTLDDLYRHYAHHDQPPQGPRPSAAELTDIDRRFYAEHRRYDAVHTIGLDVAGHAVAYAKGAGILDEGYAEDLEHHEPSAALRRALGEVSLITVSGGVGYVTERTFTRLVQHLGPHAWVLALVLRTVSYDGISAALTAQGLTTARAGTTYLQRRFTSAAEQRHALDAVAVAGRSPQGLETDGYYHTDLYLSGPAGLEVVSGVLDEVVGR